MQALVELHLIVPAHWLVVPAVGAVHLIAPKHREVLDVWMGGRKSLQDAADRLGYDLHLCVDRKVVKRIKATRQQPAPNSNPIGPFDQGVPSLKEIRSMSDELLLSAIAQSSNSACITTIEDNKIVAANFAVVPSHGKPYHKMIGSDLTSLWDVEELTRIMRPLELDGYAMQQDYWTWKWERTDTAIYTRVKQTLVRNFYLIQFDGVPCRLTVGLLQ